MLSTWHNNSIQQLKRKAKNNVEQQIEKPTVICDYNRHMGGVDVSDQYVSSYSFIRKSKKWWRKMFFWLLEVAVVNSFILYNLNIERNQKSKLSHKKYRLQLIKSLVGDVRNRERRKRGRPSISDEEERLNGKPHFIYANEKSNSKDCAVCSNRKVKGGRRETVYYCKTCTRKPGLHPGECFEKYHTLKTYK